MAFFSFRAECPADLVRFKVACASAGVTTSLAAHTDGECPDVDVELESSASLDALREVMRGLNDGHVMLQTIRECRLKENTLARDYDLE